MANWKSSAGLALACAMAMGLLGPANAQQDGLVTERNISLNMAKAIAETAVDTCRKMGYQISSDRGRSRRSRTRIAARRRRRAPHLENSQRKAYTARTFKVSTTEFRRLLAGESRTIRADQSFRRDRDPRRSSDQSR